MEWSEIIKGLKEFEGEKIDNHYTILYQKSISGGFAGCLKEYPGVVSQAELLEELPYQLTLALAAMKEAERLDKVSEK